MGLHNGANTASLSLLTPLQVRAGPVLMNGTH